MAMPNITGGYRHYHFPTRCRVIESTDYSITAEHK